MRKQLNHEQAAEIKHLFNIVLITITQTEFSVALNYIEPVNLHMGEDCVYEYKDTHSQVFVLGKIGQYPVALTKVLEPGTYAQNSISNMIHESLTDWPVKYVFMIGICATTDEKDFPIGSVVISKEIIAYERVKYDVMNKNMLIKRHIVENIIDRSPRFYPGSSLKSLDSFIADFKPNYKIKVGAILSGEKLVNSKKKLAILKQMYPNAIALEMEGAGMASALNSIDVNDWVLIKGASDNAYRKSGSDKQPETMRNVMNLVKYYFSKENLFAPGVKVLSRQELISKNVLISGSFPAGIENHDVVEDFSFKLASSLVKNGYKIITGYGQTVGAATVAGAYQQACFMRKNVDDVLDNFPFPRVSSNQIKGYLTAIKQENRNEMIKQASIAIFIYGQKKLMENLSSLMVFWTSSLKHRKRVYGAFLWVTRVMLHQTFGKK